MSALNDVSNAVRCGDPVFGVWGLVPFFFFGFWFWFIVFGVWLGFWDLGFGF
jgi:hypothetical protein